MTFAPIYLTDDEIERITGSKHRSAQIRWLSESGWRYAINRRDEIVIARSHAERMLGADVPVGRPNLAMVK
jgi:hypothetical protein